MERSVLWLATRVDRHGVSGWCGRGGTLFTLLCCRYVELGSLRAIIDVLRHPFDDVSAAYARCCSAHVPRSLQVHAAAILHDTIAGLQALHAHRVIHRDIKVCIYLCMCRYVFFTHLFLQRPIICCCPRVEW